MVLNRADEPIAICHFYNLDAHYTFNFAPSEREAQCSQHGTDTAFLFTQNIQRKGK